MSGPGDGGRRPGRPRGRSTQRGRGESGRSAARPDARRRTTASTRISLPHEPPESGERAPIAPDVRRRFTSRAAVLLAVFVLLVVGLAVPFREYVEQRGRIAELQTKERTQEQKITELRREQKRLNDPAYIEQQARERLHYAKPGEFTYVVIDPERSGGEGVRKPARAEGPSWSQRLWSSVRVADRPRK
ncbi:MAG: septum formation initiator family protein [Streptosporangiales bacterium]|nr:septum formation initiator family protein [Streptosporangiales bacterium]